MNAALTNSHRTAQPAGGLSRTRPGRDLYQIAELVELCFTSGLDASGRAAVEEMKFIARFWPLTWLLLLLDRPGLGTGFVWRLERRVIGNVSLYPSGAHPNLGIGWLVANVAVHPNHRRQGIARALMEASLSLVREQHARWAALQVEANNAAAQELYRQLGFATYETLEIWERTGFYRSVSPKIDAWPIRLREPREASAEADLIYHRARLGAMAWGQPIERTQVWGKTLSDLVGLLGGQYQAHWVLPDPNRTDRLLGAMWVDSSGWRSARMSLFLDPELRDPDGRQALLQLIFNDRTFEGWPLRIETTAGDPLIEEILLASGFSRIRALTQMRYLL